MLTLQNAGDPCCYGAPPYPNINIYLLTIISWPTCFLSVLCYFLMKATDCGRNVILCYSPFGLEFGITVSISCVLLISMSTCRYYRLLQGPQSSIHGYNLIQSAASQTGQQCSTRKTIVCQVVQALQQYCLHVMCAHRRTSGRGTTGKKKQGRTENKREQQGRNNKEDREGWWETCHCKLPKFKPLFNRERENA